MTPMLRLAVALVAAALVIPAAPSATAHTCASYHGCDEDGCKDGEDHDHTNYNTAGRDENCKSSDDDDTNDDPPCVVLGQRFPEIVCDGPQGEGGGAKILA